MAEAARAAVPGALPLVPAALAVPGALAGAMAIPGVLALGAAVTPAVSSA